MQREHRRDSWRVAGVSLLVAASLLVVACGGGSSSSSSSSSSSTSSSSKTTSTLRSTSWSLPGADLQNSRAVGGPINASDVSTLGVAWTVPITATGAFGGYATTPVVAKGVLYTQDLASNVEAIDFTTGRVLWTHKYNSASVGPNGVTVANGTVYGATADSAFALRAATGKQLWIRKLTRNRNEGIDMAPGYNNGTVYVSTVPGTAKVFYAGNGQAILSALDASTGAIKWKWDEVPTDLWSNKHTNLNSGGGQWHPPSFDSAGNLYVGVSNPAPFTGTPKFPWGSSRPGPDLYTNSIVKLKASTGKLIWHYQLTPHDIYDWDLQNPPLLTTVNGRQVAIDGGKAGIVVAVDAQTGKPIWKRSVGVHNGHDNDNLAALKRNYSGLHIPETIEPGDLGGMESQLATNGQTVFAAVNNLATRYKGQGLKFASFPVPPAKGTGDFVAIDAATGKVNWDVKLTFSPYGAATIANDVVFTTTFDGTLHGFNVDTGKEVWSTKLSAGTNAPVAVVGNTLITAGTLPGGPRQKALIIAYRLGATGKLPVTTSTKPTPGSASPPSSPSSLNLAAKGNQLLFNTNALTAKAGKVTVDFANNSALQHNVTLSGPGNKILGKTPTFAGGSKSFSATLKPGAYTYYCSVPGHRQAGMQGTLTVK